MYIGPRCDECDRPASTEITIDAETLILCDLHLDLLAAETYNRLIGKHPLHVPSPPKAPE